MLTSVVATLRDLLACTPVASRLLLATGDPGDMFSVGAGGFAIAQNGRVQLPRPFLVVILFGGELLTVLRNASLARADQSIRNTPSPITP